MDPMGQTPEMAPYYDMRQPRGKISVRHLNFFYGSQQALFDNNIKIVQNAVTAIIGPSGCGKSTHIRAYNRIFELYPEQRADGGILLEGANVLDPDHDLLH